MVEDEILESLRHEPKLREVAQKIEADMSIEATSALKGAEEILQTFAQVVPDLPWAQGTMGSQS
ncbi:MAG: methylmalonyl Co-A mutase-associated GTPase MeaB, partial [Cutibacterium granulosum]|nr:methylmalonyl Co-A mutase-associated GTPase MeaB [Cutibacterium granulosum]